MKSRVGRFPPQPPPKGRRDRDARFEIRAVLLGKGGEGGGHDDVDGGLKGNERGMMEAWVRGSLRRLQGMVYADRREPEGKKKKKETRRRKGRGMMFRGSMQSATATDCLAPGRNGSWIRYCLCLFARCRRMPLTIMHSLLRRQIIRS